MRSKLALLACGMVSAVISCASSDAATRSSDGSGGQAGSEPASTAGSAGMNAGMAGMAGMQTGAAGSAGGAVPDAAVSHESGNGATGCASLPICDDFETADVGGPPSAMLWKVGAPNGMGDGKLAIDGMQAHSGSKSVRVDGKAGYSNHIFFYNDSKVAGIGKVMFGRMYVRFGQTLADGHTTILAMKDTGDMKDLRMGGQAKILMYNRESNDATLPALSPTGISKSLSPAANTWLCIEFKIDGNTGEIDTWVDGTEVAGLHADATPTPDIDQQWASGSIWKPTLVDAKFGWESYAGGDMTLWFDDVALGAERIGCN